MLYTLKVMCGWGVEVAVCGGGVVETSVAYHLAEKGVKDVVHLEQGRWWCTKWC